jgi:transcriptional regulator GlxA family with amidase domain
MNQIKENRAMNVAFLVYDQVEVLDLNGPLDVFVKANAVVPGSYTCYTVGHTVEPVYTEANTMAILPNYGIDSCPRPDMIVIPGAHPDQIMRYLQDEKFQDGVLKWVTAQYAAGVVIFTICTGSILLSRTGLLANRTITTHAMLLDKLEEYNPSSTVKRDVRYVDDGQLITTAGITAGIDAALYVIAKQQSEEVAAVIVQLFEYQQAQKIS